MTAKIHVWLLVRAIVVPGHCCRTLGTGDRVERLLAGGALTYLTKPFRISEFLAVIRETLDRRAEVNA
jgi:CheY-like chemotaxis protein